MKSMASRNSIDARQGEESRGSNVIWELKVQDEAEQGKWIQVIEKLMYCVVANTA
jgi:hypothetical protein